MLKVVNERLSKSFINFRSKFVSKGNSSQISHSILNAFKLIKKKIKTNPFFFFFEAVERVRFSILLQVFERKKKKTIKKIVIPKLIKK
jgi:DNA helicase HerA-like ATPase